MYISPELEAKATAELAKHQSEVDRAAEEGGKWLDEFIKRKGIDRDNLTKGQWFVLTREIPCSIRCWRIGQPVDTKPGQPCPECGKMTPLPTAWERILTDA